MPLRLALMVAIGALLALGACSSDTKTVTAPADDPAPMQPDPDPDPDPTPDPAAVTLPAGAADAFPTGDTSFTIRSTETDVDDNGNRFVDKNGYRFVCLGEDACVVTVNKDADGMLLVTSDGDGKLQRGEVPAVTDTPAIKRFVRPASGNRQQFILAAGETETQNNVMMACPAASTAGCTVVIETRTAGDEAGTDVIGTGGVTLTSVYPAFYEGLAYFDGTGGDPNDFSFDLGSSVAAFDGSANVVMQNDEKGGTTAHLRNQPVDGTDRTAGGSRWNDAAGPANRRIMVDVAAMPVDMSGRSGMFGGFADGTSASDMAKTYGATEIGDRRLALELTASGEPPGGVWGTLAWTVELPEVTGGSVAFADALTRSPDSMWTTGFSDTMRLGGDTSGDADDGTLHYQLFTDFDANKKVEPRRGFGDTGAIGAIAGTVLVVGDDDEVPDAVPDSQTIVGGDGTNGTFDGVPGTFVCSVASCTVTTAANGTQTLAGGTLNFTPVTGAQVVEDTDWLAIGSWAVAMDNGATVFGAFFEHAGEGNQSHATSHQQAQGTATYNGSARGHYAEYNAGARQAGVFAATATFEADFGSAAADGDIYGMLRGFSTTEHGMETAADRDAWTIDFASAADPHDFSFGSNADEEGFEIDIAATSRWGAETDNTLRGQGYFKLYRAIGADIYQYTAPTAIAGAFVATSGTNDDNYDLSLVGAIGAKR